MFLFIQLINYTVDKILMPTLLFRQRYEQLQASHADVVPNIQADSTRVLNSAVVCHTMSVSAKSEDHHGLG